MKLRPQYLRAKGKGLFAPLSESLFTDMAPRWEGVPSAGKMEGYRQSLEKSLRRKPFAYYIGALALSATLEGCLPHCRCHSGGCPTCLRAAQWNVACFIPAYHDFSVRTLLPSGVTGVFVTIVPTEWQRREGSLDSFRITEQLSRLRRILTKMPTVEAAFLGVDFSFNDNRKKRKGTEFWQPHIHGVMWVRDRNFVARVLKKLFPKSATVHTPVQVKAYNGKAKGAAYCFKTYFERRVAFRKEDHPARKPFWTTKYYPLRVRQRNELALFLNKIEMRTRVLNFHRRHENGLPKQLE